jgi:hypothetical protein
MNKICNKCGVELTIHGTRITPLYMLMLKSRGEQKIKNQENWKKNNKKN